jgi:hypothetical protein
MHMSAHMWYLGPPVHGREIAVRSQQCRLGTTLPVRFRDPSPRVRGTWFSTTSPRGGEHRLRGPPRRRWTRVHDVPQGMADYFTGWSGGGAFRRRRASTTTTPRTARMATMAAIRPRSRGLRVVLEELPDVLE